MEKVEIKNHIKQIRGITYGGNDSINHPKENYLPVLRSNNINEGSLNFEDLVYVPENLIKEVQLLKKGDLLITASTGSVKVIGKNGAVKNDYNGSFGAFCKVVRPLKSVNPDYLKHFFQTKYYRTTIQSVINGANINNIKNEHLDNLEIPLPPLPTQQKIAAILDKADELRQYNKQLIEKYDALTQSLFLEMFGDPVRNEKGWEVTTFSKILSKIESGWSPVCENKPRTGDQEWAVLKLGSVSYGIYNPKENKRYEFDLPKAKQDCEVKKGDLLFTRKNTYHMVGVTAFVYETSPKLLLPDTVFRLVLIQELTNPIFLHYLLNHDKFSKEIQLLASGSSGSMPNISKAKLLSKDTILPPLALQTQFAERVQMIETQKQQVQEALAKSEDLFQSLLQRAFKGELIELGV